jgi:hypothetical protein
MRCPKCKSPTEVLETIQQSGKTKRRRKCLAPACLYRFASYETPEGTAPTTKSTDPSLPEWLENVKNRPGVDKEALVAAYNVDRRRKEIMLEQRRRARMEREFEDDPPMTKEELMRELRGY